MIHFKLIHLNKYFTTKATPSIAILALLMLLLASCTAVLPPVEAPYSTIVNERLLNEPFDSLGDWASYHEDNFSLDVVDGQFRIESTWVGKFVWSSNYQSYTNTVIELDIDWLSDDDKAMTGIMCRGQGDGSGYYVLISQTGQFSIRRVGQYNDNALRDWQRNADIPRNGEAIRMRVVCVDDYIGLYVNGQYIDGASDSLLSKGFVGLVAGLSPKASSENRVAVAFDDLRVWDAALK